MSGQTVLNIILGLITAFLAVKNYLNAGRKDAMRESQEMTEVRVQLNQVMEMLRSMQQDIRTSSADYRTLSERVVVLETKVDSMYKSINELKGEHNGTE